MAEGDGIIYNTAKQALLEGEMDLANLADTLKVALFTATYVPNVDTDANYASLGNECSGTGYTAGGATLASQVVALDTTNDRASLDGDDITWTSLGTLSPQPAWAVLYDDTHATNQVIAYWEVATPTNGGNWTLQFSTSPSCIMLLT